MRAFISLIFLLGLSFAACAGTIQKGATMQVKPDSIWFQDSAELAHWQRLKKAGNATALAAYQDKILGNRDAWQFVNRLNVKILSYELRKKRVNVEMKTEGRMQGTTWLLDPDALVQ